MPAGEQFRARGWPLTPNALRFQTLFPSPKLFALGLVLLIAANCQDGSQATDSSQTADGGGTTPVVRQCQERPELQQSCACYGSVECFVLSDSYGVCGTRNGPEATTCTEFTIHYSDQCGCDGATCPDGQSCREIRETVSGGSFSQNRCYATCQSAADCAEGQACLPNRFDVPTCITPECRSDADCTEDDCGHCTRERWVGGQGVLWGTAPRCVYEGKPDASSCRGSTFVLEHGAYPAYFALNVHTCHEWILDDPQL